MGDFLATILIKLFPRNKMRLQKQTTSIAWSLKRLGLERVLEPYIYLSIVTANYSS
jgi:hypothetical protein